MNVQPSVAEYDGTYNYDARKHVLTWNIPVIDAANKSGSMEFSCNSSIPGDFFPVQVSFLYLRFLNIFYYFSISFSLIKVSFVSKTPYAALKAKDVVLVDNDSSVKFSTENILFVDKYEIV